MSIRSELETKINTYAQSKNPDMYVYFENTALKKPTDGSTYLETEFLTPVTINPTVDATRERETGIMQVLVCTQYGKGAKQAQTIANEIKALFPVVPKTGTVSIERPPQIGSGMNRDDGWYCVPVRISYRQER